MWRYGEWTHCHKCQRSYHTWIYKRQTTASTFNSSAVYSLRGVSEHSSEQITIWHKNQIGLHSYFNFINMLIFSKYFNKCVIKTHELSLLCFILFHKLSTERIRTNQKRHLHSKTDLLQDNSKKLGKENFRVPQTLPHSHNFYCLLFFSICHYYLRFSMVLLFANVLE